MANLTHAFVADTLAIAALIILLLIAYLVQRVFQIHAIEEITVAFDEDMPLHRRKERLMQEIADKQSLLEQHYPPDKIRSLDAYIYKDGLEEELDFDRLDDLDQADFVHIQYVITK